MSKLYKVKIQKITITDSEHFVYAVDQLAAKEIAQNQASEQVIPRYQSLYRILQVEELPNPERK